MTVFGIYFHTVLSEMQRGVCSVKVVPGNLGQWNVGKFGLDGDGSAARGSFLCSCESH